MSSSNVNVMNELKDSNGKISSDLMIISNIFKI